MKKTFKWGMCLLLILAVGTMAFAQKKTTLVYLSKWSPEEVTAKIIDDAITDWEKDNPNVTVEREWAGRQVNAKLMAMIQAGTPPDFYDEDPKLIENSIGKAGQALDLLPLPEEGQGVPERQGGHRHLLQGLLRRHHLPRAGQLRAHPAVPDHLLVRQDPLEAARA